MKIECFLAEGCGSKEKLKSNIERALLEENIEAEVIFRVVSQEEAEQFGIGGSPTVWIDGKDIELGVSPAGIS